MTGAPYLRLYRRAHPTATRATLRARRRALHAVSEDGHRDSRRRGRWFAFWRHLPLPRRLKETTLMRAVVTSGLTRFLRGRTLARLSNVAATIFHEQPEASPAADWPRLGRAAAAATLSQAARVRSSRSPSCLRSTRRPTGWRWVADHDARAQISKVFDSIAITFLIGAAIVYLLLARRRAPRLAWTGGILLVMGMVGLAMVNGAETVTLGSPTILGSPRRCSGTPSTTSRHRRSSPCF